MWTTLLLLPRRLLILLVQGYRYLLKPWLGNACRFEPTCSAYSLGRCSAMARCKGSAMTVAAAAALPPLVRRRLRPGARPLAGLGP
jgi:putative component of membrane protein insertase Oxa1/YidC/SpoIIIJ protein YidD